MKDKVISISDKLKKKKEAEDKKIYKSIISRIDHLTK